MAEPRKFKDFTIELRNYDPEKDTYEVALERTGEWGEPEPVSVTLKEAEISTDLATLERKKLYIEKLVPLGEQLTGRLLPGNLRVRFEEAVKAAGPNEGVRLRLLVRSSAARLAQIPWEFCYLQLKEGEKDRTHFLVLNPAVSLVRHVPLDTGQIPLAPKETSDPLQLRMLAVTASPDESSSGFPELELELEQEVLSRALSEQTIEGVTIDWEPFHSNVTWQELNDALLKEKPDILHFSGHGQFKDTDETASLILVKDKQTREAAFIPTAQFTQPVQAAGVRLAYISACQSSRQQGKTAWTAIAPALAAAGVPAVLAMQYEILDDFAILFSQTFYTVLASGLSVDEAVTAGRLACLNQSSPKGVEWGVPTLYLRSPDGILFPKLAERDTQTSKNIKIAVQQIIDTIEVGGQVIGIEFKSGVQPGQYDVIQNTRVVKGSETAVVINRWPPEAGQD